MPQQIHGNIQEFLKHFVALAVFDMTSFKISRMKVLEAALLDYHRQQERIFPVNIICGLKKFEVILNSETGTLEINQIIGYNTEKSDVNLKAVMKTMQIVIV